jgi:uncharacterized protein with ParB-like and HNH nuclease domain
MKANGLQINNFLQAPNVQFVIPVYQRNYDWTNTACKELLNAIISVETENREHTLLAVLFLLKRAFISQPSPFLNTTHFNSRLCIDNFPILHLTMG